jgi:hypothetical protein
MGLALTDYKREMRIGHNADGRTLRPVDPDGGLGKVCPNVQ